MVGQQAALESKDEILDMVSNTDLVFVTAGNVCCHNLTQKLPQI